MGKGYNSKASIPADYLAKLNNGYQETVTLAEWLAVDQSILLVNVYNDKLKLKERLDKVKVYAIDKNMNVREIAWYSVRPFVAMELETAIVYRFK